ncbi:SpaH/EbpB family LPXTG-anchored major pilin [Schaalia canis]|uniref:Isopeptide-forming domain-containing fimbrial protein n=1 Tax=Schaalia canis TaxID=100469 RepID=A0A3P1SFQ8_9ACTO|nr:SpaH/EbpB family LPXTG-anchored major pilin [Schaalia canis]RRC95819.1 isopeptide-forming domain-containing fimbrial protein [Schaalia canis]
MALRKKALVQRLTAGMGVLALTAAGALSAVGSAYAAPGNPEFDANGNIDTSKTGSITLVKKAAGGTSVGTADGASEAAGEGLAGAVFTIHEVEGTNLGVDAGWKKFSELRAKDLSGACANPDAPSLSGFTFVKKAETQPTAATGKAEAVTGLPLRAYLVCEKTKPSKALKLAAPFLVTIPTPFEKNGNKGWLYDVTVYPKSVVSDAPSKTQTIGEHAVVAVADNVAFSIKAGVPALDVREHFKYFIIADPMVEQLTDPKIDSVTLADADGQNPVAIAVNDHYINDIQADKHWVAVKFTKKGLSTLKANPGKVVTVNLKATVASLPNAGTIKNVGYLLTDTVTPPLEPGGGTEQPEPEDPYGPPETPGNQPKPNDPVGPNPPKDPVPTAEEVVSNWGSYTFSKVNGGDENQKLKGAGFKVYVAQNQGVNSCDPNQKATAGNALTFASGDELFTNDEGKLVIPGVLIEQKSVPKGTADPGFTKKHLCLVVEETTAPAGYTLPTDAKTVITLVPGVTDASDTTKIPNTKQSVPELPMTGAAGQVLLFVGGASMLLFAAGGYLLNRRRHAHARDI